MKSRLWYPQFDIYDTVRRLGLLLLNWGDTIPSSERLNIADFYLANPPLLHSTKMPLEVRKKFTEMEIEKPQKSFLSYPEPPVLFRKMSDIQRMALQALAGKGIVSTQGIKDGAIELSEFGTRFVQEKLSDSLQELERELITFLANDFATIGKNDLTELRERTGLRRPLR
tara:strand:- start:32522 stop:33031 length:510 start_codon:yes stop_codon:yes gene_type:complete